MEKRDKWLKAVFMILFLALLFVSVGLLLAGYFQGHFDSVESMADYIGSFGSLGPIMLTAIQLMQSFLPVIPSFFGYLAGAALFGVVGGFLCNYIGMCLGSCVAFFLAKRFGASFVKRILGEKSYNKVLYWAESKKSLTALLWLSILIPLAPDCALFYLCGLLKMPTKKYVLIVLAAKPWCILLYSLLFSRLF